MTTVSARPRRNPPGPPRTQAMRMLRVMNRDRLGMMTDAAKAYGDAVRIPVGPKWLYFFNHPDHARHILADNAAAYHKGIGLVHARRALGDGLLTSEGELWRKQRRVIQPAFQHRRIVQQAGVIAAEATALVDRLLANAGGGPVDVVREMTGLTLGVLGAALMDTDLRAFANVDAAFAAVQEQAMFELATLGSVPMFLPLPHQLRFRKAKRELRSIVEQLVAERGRDVDGRDDVLSRLVLSVAQESDPRVAKQRLNDELVTLLLAGHETTASTLSWSLYLIDTHPEVRARLHAEAIEVLGDRAPVADDLHRLRYTTMVIEEVMRLYPPVWILPRAAQEEDEVGGYHIPSGADVLVCPFTMHRHPDFWPDPLRFDPSRFDPAASVDRPRYAYLPFGGGPRFCVGNHLGMMEAVLVLATLMRDLELRLPPGHQVVAEPMMSLRIRGGLPMTVHKARS